MSAESSSAPVSTADQLDQLVLVASPRGWLVLAALGLLLVSFTVWGIVGRMATRVEGRAILLGGNVAQIVARGAGQVRVELHPGQAVEPGTVLAEIDEPALLREIEGARAKLVELKRDQLFLTDFAKKEVAIKEEYNAKQRAILEQVIRQSQERLTHLADQLKGEQALVAEGLAKQRDLLPTQDTINGTVDTLARAQAELTQLRQSELADSFQTSQKLLAGEQAIHDGERTILKLEEDLALQSRVTSPYRGRVLEVMVDDGAIITAGQAVAKLAVTREKATGLHAIAYVSAEEGKQIQPGMRVQLAPSTVRTEESGYLMGEVTRVSEFPATTEAMQNLLKNDKLVARLAASGSPYEVAVRLVPDSATPTGYAWTTGRGPAVPLHDGTIAGAFIVVESRRPIESIFPALSRLFSRG